MFSFILLFGYNAIRDFSNKADDVSYLKFVKDIENSVKVNSGYGDVAIKTFSVSNYEEVCFVDSGFSDKADAGLCKDDEDDFNPVICDAWKETEQNVFLVPMAPNPIKVFDLTPVGGYVCVPVVNGKITVRLEGQGDSVKVSRSG